MYCGLVGEYIQICVYTSTGLKSKCVGGEGARGGVKIIDRYCGGLKISYLVCGG